MLFRRAVLEGIAAGEVTLAFRRWKKPTVKAGTMLRTAAGVVAIEEVAIVEEAEITEADAAKAGFESPAELLESLTSGGDGVLHRIRLRFDGADPRIALRDVADLDEAEDARLRSRLDRLDEASRHGRWTRATLAEIDRRPGVAAVELSAALGREKAAFKTDVRKLKELGLTESLDVGYRLSPRGRAVLKALI